MATQEQQHINHSVEEEKPKFNLYDNEEYNKCKEDAQRWENEYGSYYKSIMCCREIEGGCTNKTIEEAYEKIKPHICNSLEEVMAHKQKPVCVLPIGHEGKCCSSLNNLFINKQFQNSMAWIWTTEGDDSFIYKNRASRLFPIAIPDSFEKKIKDKNHRLSCAIPIKNATTSLMAAAATWDYAVLHCGIHPDEVYMGFTQGHVFVNKEFLAKYNLDTALLSHKAKMITVYAEQNKTLFDNQGCTICPVIGQRIGIQHVLNPDRCNPLGIQLGHVLPRSNTRHTIRGFNLVLMTRTGNRLVGEHDFNSQDWLEILRSTVTFHSSHA